MPILVQLGQCGNQIGSALCQQLHEEGDRTVFFTRSKNHDLIARAILVDMEPKVLSQVVNQRCFKYDPSNVISSSSGSANNWAHGYNVHGPTQIEKIIRRVQKVADQEGAVNDGILVTLALAGGTGSGLGTRVCEALREHFGRSMPILVHAVWPYESGEIVTQNYNIVLALAKLYQVVDGIWMHSNQVAHDICRTRFNLKKVTFGDINRLIANDLTSCLLPAVNKFSSLSTMPLFSIISDLCAHPAYKLLASRSLPQYAQKSFQNYSTDLLIKYMHQLGRTGHFNEDQGNLNFKNCTNHALARSVYYRGADRIDLARLNDDFAPILSDQLRFHPYHSDVKFGHFTNHLTTLSNDQSWISLIDSTVEQSWSMYCNHAYIHNYAKHGIDQAEFAAAFAQTEQIIHSYRALSSSD